jgi:hypothetical protein
MAGFVIAGRGLSTNDFIELQNQGRVSLNDNYKHFIFLNACFSAGTFSILLRNVNVR